MTTTPLWVRVSGQWHVQMARGARITACNKRAPESAPTAESSQPTICNTCRLHFRDAKKGASNPRPGARRPDTLTTTRYGPPPQTSSSTRQPDAPRPTNPPPPRPGRRRAPVITPAMEMPAADLLGVVADRLDELRDAVADARAARGRDAIRALPWGCWLDAMDAGLSTLHPDDLAREVLRAGITPMPTDEQVRDWFAQRSVNEQVELITERAWVRWFLQWPIHQRLALLEQAWGRGRQGGGDLAHCVISVRNGVPSLIADGSALAGAGFDAVIYTGAECDPDWLRDVVATRFLDAEASRLWLASLQTGGEE